MEMISGLSLQLFALLFAHKETISHMELETTKAVLMAQDLSEVQNIVLIHLSDRNSDKNLFTDQVSVQTGMLVRVAYGGLTMIFFTNVN